MSIPMQSTIDRYERPLRDLRISVTDRCNFRCTYCMPEELFGPDYPFMDDKTLLDQDELIMLIRSFVSLGVEKVRITGGEPLLRRDIVSIIARMKEISEVQDIALTTNGSLLRKHALELKKAGLDRVNISLDSLDDKLFGKMNGRGIAVQTVLRGIEQAVEVGLGVKINMVVQKGVNDHDILPMAKFFKEKKIPLRFIEYMDVGNSNGWKLDQVVSSREIMSMIHQQMPIMPAKQTRFGDVAEKYEYLDGSTEVGFISSISHAFCSSCTRARLSADGKLYTCLFASNGFDLREHLRSGKSEHELTQFIRSLWNKRDDRYSELRSHLNGSTHKVEMSHIGG